MRTLLAAALLGLSAFWLAKGAGIPTWRDWDSGDATDIAVCVFCAVLLMGSK